jgi:hypothetical protein
MLIEKKRKISNSKPHGMPVYRFSKNPLSDTAPPNEIIGKVCIFKKRRTVDKDTGLIVYSSKY